MCSSTTTKTTTNHTQVSQGLGYIYIYVYTAGFHTLSILTDIARNCRRPVGKPRPDGSHVGGMTGSDMLMRRGEVQYGTWRHAEVVSMLSRPDYPLTSIKGYFLHPNP